MNAPPRIVIATPHGRYDRLESTLRDVHGFQVMRIRNKADLAPASLRAFNPGLVVFPHWSWLIPAEIHAAFECIVFHMTDLPFGRGGSPLQNLIVRGIQHTQLSALRCEEGLDTGPIYMKRPLSLHGSAEDILLRAAHLMEGMVAELALSPRTPTPQTGEVTVFQRRQPHEGDLSGLNSLDRIHDHIRMLDAQGYPNAFVQIGGLRLEFTKAHLSHDHITADVRITLPPSGTET